MTYRVCDDHEYDRDCRPLLVKCRGRRSALCDYQVGLEGEQLFRENTYLRYVAAAPTNLHPKVAPDEPTQLSQLLHKSGELRFSIRIIFIECHKHANPSYRPRLLCVRVRRAGNRRTYCCNELAPSHSITSSARARSVFTRCSGVVLDALPLCCCATARP